MNEDHLEAIWALPAQSKVAVPFVVKWYVGVLDVAGDSITDITQKSDHEPASVALKSSIVANQVSRTAVIDPPVRESRASGAVGVAVRIWQGQFRTLRHFFGTRMGNIMPADNVMFRWLVVWTVEILLKYWIRKDGRTLHEAMTGQQCSHQAVSFGERAQFKMATDKNDRRKGQTG